MSHENPNPNHNPLGAGFWEFIRSMDNLNVDQTSPPNDSHPPPPPPPPPRGASPPPPPWHSHNPAGDFINMEEFPFSQAYGGGWAGRSRWGHGGRGRFHEHRRHRSRTPSEHGSRSRSASPRPQGAAREEVDRENEHEHEHEHERPSSPHGERGPHPHNWGGRRGRRGHGRGGRPPFGGPFGSIYGGWHAPGHHGPHGHGHHHFEHRDPPPPAFDPTATEFLSNLASPEFLTNLAANPIIRNILQNIGSLSSQINPQSNNDENNNRNTAETETVMADNDDGTFTPATDIFTTPTAYTLHVSLPGAKKEDIGVHYSATSSTLTISGVIYRPGNEEFLATMTSSERKVGMFEKNIVLREDDGVEIDGDGITAKLEDGVLAVTVPRIDNEEWEDVKRVDIE